MGPLEPLQRKSTPTTVARERVAIAEAVAERLGKRQGERTDLGTSGNISLSDKGQARDIAAAKCPQAGHLPLTPSPQRVP